MNYTKAIKERVLSVPPGTIFSLSDFADLAEANVIRQVAYRLRTDGLLQSVTRGIYLRTDMDQNPNTPQVLSPDLDAVADAIARTRRWSIAPFGRLALQKLQLSIGTDPVPIIYASDGPNVVHEYRDPTQQEDQQRIQIIFRHQANRDITGMSTQAKLLIQALRYLGKDGLTDEKAAHLAQQFDPDTWENMIAETRTVTWWIYDAILRLAAQAKQMEQTASQTQETQSGPIS